MGTITIGALALDAILVGGLGALVLPKIFGGKTAKECCSAANRVITDAEVVLMLREVAAENPDKAAACDEACCKLAA